MTSVAHCVIEIAEGRKTFQQHPRLLELMVDAIFTIWHKGLLHIAWALATLTAKGSELLEAVGPVAVRAR